MMMARKRVGYKREISDVLGFVKILMKNDRINFVFS